MTATGDSHIVIAGAGSIGCFLGGVLTLAGRKVTLLARERIRDEIVGNSLRITDLSGLDTSVDAAALAISSDPAVLAKGDVILVTVKSTATQEMAALINQHAKKSAVIVSFQNGVSNADVLRAELGQAGVVAGMVPFNVVSMGQGRFHRGTSGEVMIAAGEPGLAELLTTPLLPVLERHDMRSVQWGKLVVNLNNALNALSDIPLQEQLESRAWRSIVADQMDEALSILEAAGIVPEKALALPPKLLPRLMRLPTPLFRIIAGRMLKIDPTARSSMWEDLQRGRRTEIEQLQGAVVALAKTVSRNAPLCERVATLIKQAEQAGAGSPGLQANNIRA